MAEQVIFDESMVPSAPPAWPKTIGIISAILGGVMTCCGACGLVQFVRGPGQMPPDVTPPPAPPPMAGVLQVIGFLLALMLLAAGILLATRRNSGRVLHLVYAIIAIPMALFGIFVQMGMLSSMRHWIDENPKLQAMSGLITAGVMLGFVIGGLMLLYNIFLLIWFGLVKRTADLGSRPTSDVI